MTNTNSKSPILFVDLRRYGADVEGEVYAEFKILSEQLKSNKSTYEVIKSAFDVIFQCCLHERLNVWLMFEKQTQRGTI